jgi:hypothetical protein
LSIVRKSRASLRRSIDAPATPAGRPSRLAAAGDHKGAAGASVAAGFCPTPASWHRGRTEIFAVLPELPGKMPVPSEGLTVGPDGTVYTPSFGINSRGAVPPPPHLFSFKPNGQLLYNVALVNPAPSPAPGPTTTLLGLVFQVSSQTLLICDLAQGIVWQADPKTGKSTVFMNTGQGSNSGLNALTFDKAGNVYVSDSFLGVIWKTGPIAGHRRCSSTPRRSRRRPPPV